MYFNMIAGEEGTVNAVFSVVLLKSAIRICYNSSSRYEINQHTRDNTPIRHAQEFSNTMRIEASIDAGFDNDRCRRRRRREAPSVIKRNKNDRVSRVGCDPTPTNCKGGVEKQR